ncbi:MAG: carbon storage regulator [Pirellulaceae bacterium]
MLVLSRKINDKIHIGGNITITVLKRKGKSILLGIEAPQNMRVIRSELNETRPDMSSDSGRFRHTASSSPANSANSVAGSAVMPATNKADSTVRCSLDSSATGTLPLLQKLPKRCRVQENDAQSRCQSTTTTAGQRRSLHPDGWTVGRMQERTSSANV